MLTIYKTFACQRLDYVVIIYDKPGTVHLNLWLERVQYNVCLANVSAIQGNKRQNIYVELGIASFTLIMNQNYTVFK